MERNEAIQRQIERIHAEAPYRLSVLAILFSILGTLSLVVTILSFLDLLFSARAATNVIAYSAPSSIVAASATLTMMFFVIALVLQVNRGFKRAECIKKEVLLLKLIR